MQLKQLKQHERKGGGGKVVTGKKKGREGRDRQTEVIQVVQAIRVR